MGIVYVWRYAKKVLHHPEQSIVYDEVGHGKTVDFQDQRVIATKRQVVASIILLASFGLLIMGCYILDGIFEN